MRACGTQRAFSCAMMNTALTQVRMLLERQQLLNQQQHKRLARKIHDEVNQKMTLLALQLSLMSESGPPEDWAASCKEWATLVMELGQSIREITNELQPRILDAFGLSPALRWFAQGSAKDLCCYCTFIAPNENVSLEPFAANELFGICREIIADIFVPAGVARVEIELEEQDGAVRLHLRANDDALGQDRIDEGTLEDIAVNERLHCLDGTAELSYSAHTGSVVTLSVPANRPMACSAH
jgi:signal transduction histidine kinase